MTSRWKEVLARLSGHSGLLGSLMVAAGIALLVVSSAFFLGQGSVAGSQEAPRSSDAPSMPDATLLLPSTAPSFDTADGRLLRAPQPTASPTAVATAQPPAPVVQPTAPPVPAPVRVVAPIQPTAAPAAPTPLPPPPTATQPPPPPPPPPVAAPPTHLTAFEADIFSQQNAQRVAAGLAPLQLDGALVAVARERSNDMVQKNYFAHVSPTGETAFILLDRYGIPYGWAGENLARNNYPDDQSVAIAMRDWMASEGHRENMLSVHYTNVGVGAAVDGSGMKYFTVVFTGPG
jgi:uncharacterized protein YkwD